MRLFVNELSFCGQARDVAHASNLLRTLFLVIREFNPVCKMSEVATSVELWQKKLTQKLSVRQFLIEHKREIDEACYKLFILLVNKGPYTETVIDQCELIVDRAFDLSGECVNETPVAAAAICEGALAGLSGVPTYDANPLILRCIVDPDDQVGPNGHRRITRIGPYDAAIWQPPSVLLPT